MQIAILGGVPGVGKKAILAALGNRWMGAAPERAIVPWQVNLAGRRGPVISGTQIGNKLILNWRMDGHGTDDENGLSATRTALKQLAADVPGDVCLVTADPAFWNNEIMADLRQAGMPTIAIWLDCSAEAQKLRLEQQGRTYYPKQFLDRKREEVELVAVNEIAHLTLCSYKTPVETAEEVDIYLKMALQPLAKAL